MPNGHCQSLKNKSRGSGCFFVCFFSLPVAIPGVLLCCSTLCLFILWNPTLFHGGCPIKRPWVYIQSQPWFYQQRLTQPLAPGMLLIHTGANSHVHQPPPPHAGFCSQNMQKQPRCAAKKSITHPVIANLDNEENKTIHVGREAARRASSNTSNNPQRMEGRGREWEGRTESCE